MQEKVKLRRWSERWKEASRRYEHEYLPHMRQLAQCVDWRFTVGLFGWDQRFIDKGLLGRDQVTRCRDLVRKRNWLPLYGAGPRSMFGTRHRELHLDALGSLCAVYIANDMADVDTFLQVSYVLQLAQKVYLAKQLGKHRDYEYFYHPACTRYGYYPRMICVGETWKPLFELIDMFGEQGCIREVDRDLFVHVPDLESALREAQKDFEAFETLCRAEKLTLRNGRWKARELNAVQAAWRAARNAFNTRFLSELGSFADMAEHRLRIAGYGSHLADIGNSEAERFGVEMHGLGVDTLTGGGPKVMNAMGAGVQSAREGKRSGPSPADDERLLAGPKVMGLTLALPDEQTIPAQLDLEFQNNHFWKRIMGFWILSQIHFTKRKGGFGSLLEALNAIAKAITVMKSRGKRRFRTDQAFLNPLCRDYRFVPHSIAIGGLWRKVTEMLRYMEEQLHTITPSQARLLTVVDDLDDGLEEIRREIRRIREFCRRNGYELVM